MHTLIDMLFNAGSGGLLGMLGSFATAFLRLREKKMDYAQQLAMAEVAGKNAEAAASWNAFQASQTSAASDMKADVSPWAADVRAVTRPALTLLLVLASLWLTANAPQAARAEAIQAIQLLTGTAVAWWFGSRMTTQLFGAPMGSRKIN